MFTSLLLTSSAAWPAAVLRFLGCVKEPAFFSLRTSWTTTIDMSFLCGLMSPPYNWWNLPCVPARIQIIIVFASYSVQWLISRYAATNFVVVSYFWGDFQRSADFYSTWSTISYKFLFEAKERAWASWWRFMFKKKLWHELLRTKERNITEVPITARRFIHSVSAYIYIYKTLMAANHSESSLKLAIGSKVHIFFSRFSSPFLFCFFFLVCVMFYE